MIASIYGSRRDRVRTDGLVDAHQLRYSSHLCPDPRIFEVSHMGFEYRTVLTLI